MGVCIDPFLAGVALLSSAPVSEASDSASHPLILVRLPLPGKGRIAIARGGSYLRLVLLLRNHDHWGRPSVKLKHLTASSASILGQLEDLTDGPVAQALILLAFATS